MEDFDTQGAASHGPASRSVATPSKGPAGPRGSLGTPSRPSNGTPAPRPKSDASARPPSAGISAWEDTDSLRQPGADLLEYLGKADSADSGSSTPRHSGPTTGDGNLTQALLTARKAAEAGSSNGAVGGGSDAAALARGSSQSLKSQGSGGSYTGAVGAGGSSRADARGQQPGRMSLGSSVTGNYSATEQQQVQPQQPDQADSFPMATPRTEAMETTDDGGEALDENLGRASSASSAAPDNAAAGPAGASGNEADRLRGLLYSDDEDGDDEDYQDLMTADDDALFGGVGGGGGAGGGAGAAGAAAAVRKPGGGGGSSRFPSRPAGTRSRAPSSVRFSIDGDSAVDAPTGAYGTSSNVTTTSGTTGLEPASPTPLAPAAVTADTDANDELASLGSGTQGYLSSALSHAHSRSREVSLPISPSWAETKSDDLAAASPRVGGGGAASEALGKVLTLSGRISVTGSLSLPSASGSRSQLPQPHPQAPATQQDMAAAAAPYERPALSPLAQWAPLPQSLSHQQQQQQQPGGQHAAPQQHHHPHPYASIPTPQIGEGLRQYPPQARRLYTPGQTNRSPIRGSGYVVSPAAVRPSSPSTSPGRGAYSAAHHHQPSQHQHAVARRLSSPSVALGFAGAARPRSPHELQASPFTSAGAGPGLAPDGSDEAAGPGAGGVGGPSHYFSANGSLNGGVLKMGSWVIGSGTSSGGGAAAAAAGGGGPGLGHSSSGVSRFPPAQVQNFPGGPVYRSTPIIQVAGSPSDDLGVRALEGPGAGGGGGGPGGAPAGGGVGGAGLGLAGGARSAGSPGRLSGRGGRPRVAGSSNSGVPAGAPSGTGHIRDRFGSYSAPARPSTSPYKSRASAGGATANGRSAVMPGAAAAAGGAGSAVSAAAATAVFGNCVLLAPAGGDGGDMTSAPPRSVGVPALPSYTVSLGIRHGGFKQGPPQGGGGGPGFYGGAAAGGAGGGGGFGAPFSTARLKAEDRMRSLSMAKFFGSAGAKDSYSGAAPPPDYSVLHMPLPSPRGADPSGGGGGGGSFPAGADGFSMDAAAAAAESALQYPHLQQQLQQFHQQQQQFHQQVQAQVYRKQSLPHLLGPSANVNQLEPLQAASQGPLLPYGHAHTGGLGAAVVGHLPVGPGLTSLNTRGASRTTVVYDGGLPAVQPPMVAAGAARSLSFDMSRRATSRA